MQDDKLSFKKKSEIYKKFLQFRKLVKQVYRNLLLKSVELFIVIYRLNEKNWNTLNLFLCFERNNKILYTELRDTLFMGYNKFSSPFGKG